MNNDIGERIILKNHIMTLQSRGEGEYRVVCSCGKIRPFTGDVWKYTWEIDPLSMMPDCDGMIDKLYEVWKSQSACETQGATRDAFEAGYWDGSVVKTLPISK